LVYSSQFFVIAITPGWNLKEEEAWLPQPGGSILIFPYILISMGTPLGSGLFYEKRYSSCKYFINYFNFAGGF
jgi:hypothetical protein